MNIEIIQEKKEESDFNEYGIDVNGLGRGGYNTNGVHVNGLDRNGLNINGIEGTKKISKQKSTLEIC